MSAFRSYQLVLAAAAKRVSDVYGGAQDPPNSTVTQLAAVDIPYRELKFTAESAAVYLGMDATAASNNYGATIASGASLTFGPYESGPMKLSDFWAAGNGATLHVAGVPY